jgi:hypothetical protein
MALLDVNLPPGVFANGTPRQAKGRYRLCSLVRWPDGTNLQPVGGWVDRTTGSPASVTGKARAVTTWSENSATRWIGIGTNSNLYVQSPSGSISDITPSGFTAGNANATTGGGYGAGYYGVGSYGTARPDSATITPASVWTLDTWGQYLVGCMDGDGKLYEWQLNTGTPAAAISGAPTGCAGLVVTDERFIFALKNRTVFWCDQGDNTDWTSTATNQAGDQDLDTHGRLICGRAVTGGTLVFTTADVFIARYQGLPTVYGFYKAGSDCGPVSKGSPVSLDSRCVWMGANSFYIYDGYTQSLPCEIADYIFSDINSQQISKVTGWHNTGFNEVWWHYPSGASNENDRYVVWNYQRNIWYMGELERLCGNASGVFKYPILIDGSGIVYEHEQGWDWDGEVPYARTGPMDWAGALGGSDFRMVVKGFVGDEAVQGQSEVTFYGYEWPNDPVTTFGPYSITTAPVDVLFSTRLLEMQIEITEPADARAGIYQVDIVKGSKR